MAKPRLPGHIQRRGNAWRVCLRVDGKAYWFGARTEPVLKHGTRNDVIEWAWHRYQDLKKAAKREADGQLGRVRFSALRDRIDKDREEAARAEAEKRMKGIARAYGSQEMDAAEPQLKETAEAHKAKVDRFNGYYRSLVMLVAEANAQADRFGLPRPTFAPVVIPALREGCLAVARTMQSVAFLDHVHVRALTEKCEHGLRQRRTYEEVANTPGGEILKAAGPKPWPALTARQEEIVESREREREAEAAEMPRFGADAARSTQRARLG